MTDKTEIEFEKEQAVDDIDSLLACTEASWDGRRFLARDLPRDLLSCVAIGVILTLILTPFIGGGLELWLNSLAFNTIISLCIGLAVANAFRFGLPPLRRLLPGTLANIAVHTTLAIVSTTLGAEVAVRLIDATGGMNASDFRADVFRIALGVR